MKWALNVLSIFNFKLVDGELNQLSSFLYRMCTLSNKLYFALNSWLFTVNALKDACASD